jgi:uncharacterized protein
MKAFSLLIKPVSADCNLHCDYCYYLDCLKLYPEVKKHRISNEVLKILIKKYMETEQPLYQFCWQGGEPTLLGVDFFRRVISLQQKYGHDGSVVANALQTNGTLIDDEFAKHLAAYKYLVGVSLDGPKYIHDFYRVSINRGGSYDQAILGIDALVRHRVSFNILTLVTDINVHKAKETYRYMCNQGFFYQQYIPCVEFDSSGLPMPYTISGEEWGDFLCELYDEWHECIQLQ